MTLEYFNLGHFYYLGFTIILMVILGLLLRKRSPKTIDIVVLSLMFLNVIQHIFKQEFYGIFFKDFSCQLYQRTIYNFCACLIVVSPLIYLSKSVFLKNALFYLGTGAGIMALLMVGDYVGNPIFGKEVIRYFLCHILLFVTSLLPLLLGRFKLVIKYSFFVPFMVFVVMGITIVNNVIMVGSGNYPITDKEFFKTCDGLSGNIVNAKETTYYEINFDYEGKQYYYEVNFDTGKIMNKESQVNLEYAKAAALSDAGLYGNDIIFDENKMVIYEDKPCYCLKFIYYGMKYEYYIQPDDFKVYKKTTPVKTEEAIKKDKNYVTNDDAISIVLMDLTLLGKVDIGNANLTISLTTKEGPEVVVKKIMTALTFKVFLKDSEGHEYYWPIIWAVIPIYLLVCPLCLLLSFMVNKFIYKEKMHLPKRKKKEKATVINDLTLLKPINKVEETKETDATDLKDTDDTHPQDNIQGGN